ncbi:GDSL-type esterase/lipase family protein [Marinilabilia salmonicolor]|uniref:GDSL-like lipase/acylhydrolase family protein n=1 Tax=Marinilabilia salmonicolor TaxID=989 RepID=A0A368UWW2_9BACT|nr:GDSL-type esterase/lipase family protein [Marinilabilia salmonicolor]RCW32550.1 GDSL-like lipase/acylhydrolase family protein [Marinilabilia salmonicolor]
MTTAAQNPHQWDDAKSRDWPTEFKEVEISSSADEEIQKAYLYSSQSQIPKPLIVSLHTWSGDYQQKDPLAKEILARDWNYIHPDFRGPNNTPQSTGSELAINDIEDAINYALKNTNSDPEDVHIIGVSGGGFATLAAFLNVEYPVKSFSAWAPISDLEAWYWESVGRKQKYAGDILKAVSIDSVFNKAEALRRSPLSQDFPVKLRKDAELYIYEGVHDGYTGSVPVTHSINMYNRLVGELKYGVSNLDTIMQMAAKDSDLVARKEIIDLVTKRYNPQFEKNVPLFDREVYLHRDYQNIHLTIFDGGHEQLPQALGLIPYKKNTFLDFNILTLGDSNGEIQWGWVNQLRKMMPESEIVNISRSGRTIGFDNLGRTELNALSHINEFMDQAREQMGNQKYDFVIICLGTNDTKKVFAGRQNEVVVNFEKLFWRIKKHSMVKQSNPRLIFVTPPPMRTTNILDKYKGGNERLNKLIPQFKSVAGRKGFQVIDVYHPLLGVLDYYAMDGIHMAAEGQQIVASYIVDYLKKY